jgi:hypothetical protein
MRLDSRTPIQRFLSRRAFALSFCCPNAEPTKMFAPHVVDLAGMYTKFSGGGHLGAELRGGSSVEEMSENDWHRSQGRE